MGVRYMFLFFEIIIVNSWRLEKEFWTQRGLFSQIVLSTIVE